MPADYLQTIREQLQHRVQRLESADWQQFSPVLGQFLHYVQNQPVLSRVLQELQAHAPSARTIAHQIYSTPPGLPNANLFAWDDERRWAAISYQVLLLLARETDVRVLAIMVPQPSGLKRGDPLQTFKFLYVEALSAYLGEQLDNPRFILAQLVRFKRLCEWFWRDALFHAWEEAQPRHGEKVLAWKLYEFLYSAGIDFYLDPASASGEVDMISSQQGDERLLAEVKVFDEHRGTERVLLGFRQIYAYALDYNQPIGYLVIFNPTDRQLRFAVSSNDDVVPSVRVNQQTIFFLVIDLFPHNRPASNRPRPAIVEITEANIIGRATQPDL